MRVGICIKGKKETARRRDRVPWLAGFLIASWVFWGPSVQAEVLYEKNGVQLRGTARIITYDCTAISPWSGRRATRKRTTKRSKATTASPSMSGSWIIRAHNRTGKALSYLRADFEIESEDPPCTKLWIQALQLDPCILRLELPVDLGLPLVPIPLVNPSPDLTLHPGQAWNPAVRKRTTRGPGIVRTARSIRFLQC